MNESTSQTSKRGAKVKSFLGWFFLLLLLIGAGFVYYKYYFVFGEGVKSGYLNFAVKKGNLFKTYEGKLIQAGFGSANTGSIRSNEFEFSTENESTLHILESKSGKCFALHYREYHRKLPWSG